MEQQRKKKKITVFSAAAVCLIQNFSPFYDFEADHDYKLGIHQVVWKPKKNREMKF